MRQVGARTGGGAGVGQVIGPPRWSVPVLVGLLIALAAISFYSYPFFHMLVEGICVVVATSLFLVLFHTRRLHDNDYLLFVGIGLFFFTLLDVPHTFAYRGINLFTGFDDDLPTQAYIAQRLMLSATFLVAPLFLKRRLWLRTTFIAFSVVAGLAFLSLVVWRNFPTMFIEGSGLTPLKKNLEYVISSLFVLGGIGLVANRRYFDPMVLRLLVASLVSFVGSEIAFTLYASPFGYSNLAGHLFQVVAFYFTYQAVVVTALVNPFGLLFRELSESEQSLRTANERLNAIADISDTAISSLDLNELAPALLARLVDLMHADAAALLLAEEGFVRTLSTVGFADESFVAPIGKGFSGKIAESREPRYVEDIQNDDTILSVPLRQQGIRSVIGVPMQAGDRLVGVLHVDWRSHHAYDERDVRLLEIVADRVALAVRNAQLYEGERHIAQIFQESLLSLPEHVAGVRYAKSYHSATEEAVVGGDFFDLFPVDDASIGVLIGDVSGKGVEAAVLTSLVKDTVRAHAHEGSTPASVLGMTNALVEHYSGSETFVTVFFGLLDRTSGVLTYCNAGHPPAIAIRCDGTLTLLGPNSPLLGAFPDMPFADTKVKLGTGETLFLYTDGVVEARVEKDLYGEERLMEALRRLTGCEPEATIEAVLDDLMQFTGGKLSDDLAILALRVVPD